MHANDIHWRDFAVPNQPGPILVDSAVGDLYRVFQPYRIGPDFIGCECCVDPRDTARLVQTPLPDLKLADVDSYSFNAMTTWGDVGHFKHFLPRLLELAAQDPEGFLAFEVLLGKLEYGKWRDWPHFERAAVEGFLTALWRAELARELTCEGDARIDTILCGLGQCFSDLNRFLGAWLESDSGPACRLLAQYFLLNHDALTGHRKLANAFWDDRHEQVAQVTRWLRSAAVYEHMFDRQDYLDDRLKMVVPLLAEWQSQPQ
jgi:hypothetical protein